MAGSRKWFVYTTDKGDSFALQLDESNTEALNAGTQDFLDTATADYALPRNIKPRVLSYANVDGTRVIKAVALTPTIYNGASTAQRTITDPIGGGTLTLIRLTPEKIRIPFGIDTGLNDGDAT